MPNAYFLSDDEDVCDALGALNVPTGQSQDAHHCSAELTVAPNAGKHICQGNVAPSTIDDPPAGAVVITTAQALALVAAEPT